MLCWPCLILLSWLDTCNEKGGWMRPAFAYPWRGSSDAACELYMYMYICVSRISVILCPLSLSTLGCVGREGGGKGGRAAGRWFARRYLPNRASTRPLPLAQVTNFFSFQLGFWGRWFFLTASSQDPRNYPILPRRFLSERPGCPNARSIVFRRF